MKRIPYERLEAQIRMHQIANYTIIRNGVGQCISESFYELFDKYGIMIWDEFFQPIPNDGPNPKDIKLYMANVREKILRFRNHPSIAIWCARNEGFPPKLIDDSLRGMMKVLEPNETKTISVEAALSDLKGESLLVLVDGWNINVTAFSSRNAGIALNEDAQVSHWAATGLPFK